MLLPKAVPWSHRCAVRPQRLLHVCKKQRPVAQVLVGHSESEWFLLLMTSSINNLCLGPMWSFMVTKTYVAFVETWGISVLSLCLPVPASSPDSCLQSSTLWCFWAWPYSEAFCAHPAILFCSPVKESTDNNHQVELHQTGEKPAFPCSDEWQGRCFVVYWARKVSV